MHQLVSLRYAHSQWLLHKEMFTGFEASLAERVVCRSGRSNDNRIHLRIVDGFLPVGSCLCLGIVGFNVIASFGIFLCDPFDMAISLCREITEKIGAPIATAKLYYLRHLKIPFFSRLAMWGRQGQDSRDRHRCRTLERPENIPGTRNGASPTIVLAAFRLQSNTIFCVAAENGAGRWYIWCATEAS